MLQPDPKKSPTPGPSAELLQISRETLRTIDTQCVFDMLSSTPNMLDAINKLAASQRILSFQGRSRLAEFANVGLDHTEFPEPEKFIEDAASAAERLTAGWFPHPDDFTILVSALEPRLQVLQALSPNLYTRLEEVHTWHTQVRLPEEELAGEFAKALNGIKGLAEMPEPTYMTCVVGAWRTVLKNSFPNAESYVAMRYRVISDAGYFEHKITEALAETGSLGKEILPQFWDKELSSFYATMLPALHAMFNEQAETIWGKKKD